MKKFNIKNLINKNNSLYIEAFISLLLGYLGGLVFVKVIFLPFTIIAFIYLYHMVIEKNYKFLKVFFLSLIFGSAHFFSSLYWISISFEMSNFGGLGLGVIAVLLLSIFLSTFIIFICMFAKFVTSYFEINKIGRLLVFASLLSLGEFLRGTIFSGFPWNIIGYIWANSFYTLQGVSWLGIYGMGLFTYLAFLAPTLFKSNFKYFLVFISPLSLIFFAGFFRIYSIDNPLYSDISFSIIQPSISQKEKLDKSLSEKHLNKIISLSTERNLKIPQLFIWPESAVDFDIEKNKMISKKVFSWLGGNQLLITGATRRVYQDSLEKKKLSKIYNSIFIIGQEGIIYNFYDKKHLVPFGEFIPFRNFVNFSNFVGSSIDFSRGSGTNTFFLPSPFPKVALLVCYEIIFAGNIIRGERPDIIINITNDAWYGNTAGPKQHLMAARTRAVEEGLPVLRSANTGISAAFDAYGRFLGRLPLNEQNILDVNVSEKIKPTFFSKYGNLPFLILSIIILFSGRLFKKE